MLKVVCSDCAGSGLSKFRTEPCQVCKGAGLDLEKVQQLKEKERRASGSKTQPAPM